MRVPHVETVIVAIFDCNDIALGCFEASENIQACLKRALKPSSS
jgi:hypothetical protein